MPEAKEYFYEDAIQYISERCNLTEEQIQMVLELEMDYMMSIGIAYEMEE